MSEKLMECCAAQGVELNPEHLEACEKLFDGTLLAKLEALITKFGPEIAKDLPAVLADIAAGNYLGALTLLLTSLAAQPAPGTAQA